MAESNRASADGVEDTEAEGREPDGLIGGVSSDGVEIHKRVRKNVCERRGRTSVVPNWTQRVQCPHKLNPSLGGQYPRMKSSEGQRPHSSLGTDGGGKRS
ncbi:hypothetical protein COLO4_26309 [Corchorus olitorius]|uniref:Uncharacterized protein n=1 Tax=Corchorus olitorius TaxID=93759 RepID=A0A1R3HXP3_9ROSI|nr:hypothetical protein COLO4_26309 [Corchorus olitorius]